MTTTPDLRRHAPATLRNREPILEVLLDILPPVGTVLEIAGGSGEHAAYFAPRLVPRVWLPTDPSPAARASIAAWQADGGTPNRFLPPEDLDVHDPVWPVEREPRPDPPVSAVVCINMIHIAPWSACLSLMAGAARVLAPGGVLYLYGPYRRGGRHTAPSNAAFDAELRAGNAGWGVRDLEAVVAAAEAEGFTLRRTVGMPANNLSVVFGK
jgi:SAM-dependent methyltransferase